jgi:hypothetical protein
VLLLLALGTWTYFREYRGAAERETAEQQRERPVPFERTAVASIRLDNAAGSFHLRREEEAWRLIEPLETAADREAVEGLLSALEYARIERRIEAGGDLEGYGLAAPRATLTLEPGPDLPPRRLSIGAHAPVGDHCFALLPDDGGVALVSASLEDLATKDLLSLRDRSLVDIDPWNVRNLRLERGAETVVLAKAGEGWTLQSPVEAPADGPGVTDLLNEIDRLRASAFLSEKPSADDLARFGLERPAARITVGEDGDETGRTIRLGIAVEGGRAARAEGPVVTVPEAFWSKIAVPILDLRRKDLLALNRYRIHSMTIARQGGEALVLRRNDGGGWDGSGLASGTVENGPVDLLLGHLADLRATAFVDRPSEGQRQALSERPDLDIELEEEPPADGGEPRLQHLLIGPPDQNGQVKVRDPAWEPIALVPAGIHERMLRQLDAIIEEIARPGEAAGPAGGDPDPESDAPAAADQPQ